LPFVSERKKGEKNRKKKSERPLAEKREKSKTLSATQIANQRPKWVEHRFLPVSGEGKGKGGGEPQKNFILIRREEGGKWEREFCKIVKSELLG